MIRIKIGAMKILIPTNTIGRISVLTFFNKANFPTIDKPRMKSADAENESAKESRKLVKTIGISVPTISFHRHPAMVASIRGFLSKLLRPKEKKYLKSMTNSLGMKITS